MDEHALGFGQHEILGCPYHGLVVGNRLTLPNGQHIDNQWNTFQVRGAYRLAVPGVPGITRTPEQAAEDAARGYQWRTDSVVWLVGNAVNQAMYGSRQVNALGVYAAGMGNCWGVRLPFNASANGDYTALTAPATMSAIGRIGVEPDQRPVTVELSGYAPGRFPPENGRTFDCSPAGDRILVGSSLLYNQVHDMYTQGRGSLALIKCSGTGSEASPLRLQMEFVADLSSGDSSISDGFVPTSFYARWEPITADEFIDPIVPSDDDCQWLLHKTVGLDFVIYETPLPPLDSNFYSYVNGEREASTDGAVIGGFFASDGSLSLVTCDIEYSFIATSTYSTDFEVIREGEQVAPYIRIGGVCGPRPPGGFDPQYDVEPIIETNIAYSVSTVETLKYAMRVNSQLVQEFELKVIFSQSRSADDATREISLLLNGEVIDSMTVINPAGWTVWRQLATPVIDRNNNFELLPPEQWLPIVAGLEHRLPDVTDLDGTIYRPSVAVQVAPHWWSNNLVCLATRVRPWNPPSVGGGSRTYGPTAHPGGVVPGSITVNATASNLQPPPRFGARDPLTGTVVVGHAQRIQYL